MTTLKGLVLFLAIISGSVYAETDNFNIALTGTFDNTIPDDCTVTPLGTINTGTLAVHDILADNDTRFDPVMGFVTMYNSSVTVTVEVTCTVGVNYELTTQESAMIDGTAQVASFLYSSEAGGFLGDTALRTLSGTGTGSTTEHELELYIAHISSTIDNLSGSFTLNAPLTLTVL